MLLFVSRLTILLSSSVTHPIYTLYQGKEMSAEYDLLRLVDESIFLNFTRDQNVTEIDDGGQAILFKGSVKLPNDVELNVAMKLYKRGGLDREVEILKRLRHSNIIQFYGIGLLDNVRVSVLEYCIISLRKIINECRSSKNPIERKEFVRIATETAEGLRYLHSVNIIHCDIKPDNILLAPDKTVKICDFGTAKDQTQSLSKSIEGSTPWMAPEYIRGDPFDDKIDVWSYGLVLWELIYVRVPYDGIPPEQLNSLIGGGNGVLPILMNSFLSLENLFNACWRKNKEDRISSERILDYLRNVDDELDEITDEQWLDENRKCMTLAKVSNWRNAKMNKALAAAERFLSAHSISLNPPDSEAASRGKEIFSRLTSRFKPNN